MTTVLSRTALAAPSKARRAKQRWLRRGLSAGAVLLLAGALAWALRPQPIAVDVTAVTRGDLVVAARELAKTRVRDRYVIAAPLAGNLRRIELRAGDRIEGGATVARITPLDAPLLDPRTKAETAARLAAATAGARQASAAVERASAMSEHATDELAKARRLLASGSVAEDTVTRAAVEARVREEELASARFAVQTAEHEVAMTRAALARFSANAGDVFEVPAPATGAVLRVLMPSAGPVTPGAPLLEVGDPAALEVVTEVLSTDAVKIKPGARVRIERWGGPELDASVQRVEPAGFTRLSALGVEEQRVNVLVDLGEPRARWAALGDGYRVETQIVLDERRGVLHVPLGAIVRRAGGWSVFAVDDGRARATPVEVGARSDADVEIVSGLAEGARVVVHPSERVKDGVTVRGR